jgi:hypothetical protein
MCYRTIRLSGCNGAGIAAAAVEQPDISFIDLIFWLVVLVFGLKTSAALSLALFLSL